ncbi:MAG: hypothetical protein A2498_11710 [Lentisphaerae bacterium RIFOXYC12_FULL_60_16]|nr:MAG: hypothetical protein A2498_11710 [Lentisphaerae bacterium RIFOXYC12_FULL_60_16]OGV75153.1 MAG: hypothetical protein A2269_05805 [Lentisphaerae bacterium RIFOXYA12_FULL_60_10]OGV77266.1 MAG: hypothetical protein A2340_06055 [Lentisphaerae bacterium RIFOXYB12_FULL_60_10]
MIASTISIFEQASRVFPVEHDPDTGARLLYANPLNPSSLPGATGTGLWSTPYHQNTCFTSDRTRILLRYSEPPSGANPTGIHTNVLLNLITGQIEPFNFTGHVYELSPRHPIAVTFEHREPAIPAVTLRDIDANRPLASFSLPGWNLWAAHLLADGQRALIGHYQGTYYHERCHSRFDLLNPDGTTEQVLDVDGCFCNHIQGCPADPDLYSYNRWPTPPSRREVVNHIRDVRGTFDIELPQRPGTVRPGPLWGGQRDHYLWTPDGNRIASYFSPVTTTSRDHFDFGWWVSALDWRTGEDFAAPYPPDRWTGHFGVSPDSRFLFACGRKSFPFCYTIDIQELRNGWNERIICTCPPSEVSRENHGPFHMPFFLPDQSGVVFTAGWPGSRKGIYLVELPADLRPRTSTEGTAS